MTAMDARRDVFEHGGLCFSEPWHAELLAIAILLCETGRLDKSDLSEVAGKAISDTGSSTGSASGEDAFEAALGKLESVLAENGFADRTEIDSALNEWRQAYLDTPHGDPVKLSADLGGDDCALDIPDCQGRMQHFSNFCRNAR